MRRLLPAILLGILAGCPAGEPRMSTATWTIDGPVRGARRLDDQAGGRVTCTVDRDPADPLDAAPLFTLAITARSDGRDAPGLYLTVHDFVGEGTYVLGPSSDEAHGRALYFDAATIEDCGAAGDARCFVAEERCSLGVDSWTLGEAVAPGVRNGVATGRFDCAALENPTTQETMALVDGTFSCRASDWSESR